ncbi:MipA/OmpV family protein [Yoonia sediminilitoris]|uniref:Outer membrane scaffolding protein for murein synthesis (MipA/OmpV family) n=1 Tax=Yoonia sediminilitoris TaxID=1286148 RepID=A0A2T6KEX6_9RHOB|nr:MipA/OmpV family protein [Yoonia sediminilitoris]PUB13679.1 outer membrane scaffolding protein for murein synthesis (MipA/OmpV family) [Yoonia sediminilitoris]RCW94849.1 outer membrane scaffolding protein for murein synthesis (MipA/OmpV family) [Yoonia sediminilitoris]
MKLRIAILAVALMVPQTLFAQDADGVTLRLGVGAKSKPEYPGADANNVGATGSFSIERFQFGDFGGGGGGTGLGFGGSVRIVSERSAEEFDELTGLADVDTSIEVGGGLKYAQPGYKVFANLRYGVIGHESLVGEVGGDLIYRPSDQVTLSAGPRLFWGSDDYAQTYFGVTAEESSASAFDEFDAQGGFLSQGLKAEATYEFNEDWGVTGSIRFDRLQEDAASSPITQSEDQVTGSIVLTRRITFGF